MRHSKHLEYGPQSPCYSKISKARQADEPEKNLAVEHALSRKPFGRLLQAVTGRRYLLRHGHGEKYSDLKVIHVHTMPKVRIRAVLGSAYTFFT